MQYKAPYLPYDSIRDLACRWLNGHHVSGILPIPIEKIIEFQLKMDIVPMPNMRRDFGVEGFLSKDFSSIYIDNEMSEKFENRYRFTLAHEIGHMVLHKDFYDAVNYSNLSEWISLQDIIDSDQYSWFEKQAYDFAGLVLVPESLLLNEYRMAIDVLRDQSYMLLKAEFEMVNQYISVYLAKRFGVSEAVIQKRIAKDGLAPNVI